MSTRFVAWSAALFALSCFASSLQARADTFNFSLTGTGISATGTFTAVPTSAAANADSITSLTGTLNNGALTGDPNAVAISLIAAPTIPTTDTFPTGPGSNFYFTYDDLLFPNSSPLLDGNGLAFLSADGVSYNVGLDGSELVYEAFNDNLSFDQRTFFPVPVDLTITDTTAVTPEPSSMLLVGTGLLGIAVILRRRIV